MWTKISELEFIARYHDEIVITKDAWDRLYLGNFKPTGDYDEIQLQQKRYNGRRDEDDTHISSLQRDRGETPVPKQDKDLAKTVTFFLP